MAATTFLTTCCLATIASLCLIWSAPAAAYVAPCVVDCLLRTSKSEDKCNDWCRAVQLLEYLQGHSQSQGQGQSEEEEEELHLLSEEYDRPLQGDVVGPNKWVRMGQGVEKRVRGFVRIGRLTTRPSRVLQHSRTKRDLVDDNSQGLAESNATTDDKRAKNFVRIGRDGADSNVDSQLQAVASATESADPSLKKRRKFIRIGRENGHNADTMTHDDDSEDVQENVVAEEEDNGEEKRARNFVRIGRNGEQGSFEDDSAEFFSAHGNEKRAKNFVRIGRGGDNKRARNFVRIGRARNFVRIGRGSHRAIIETEEDNEMKKRARNFVRIGRQLALIDSLHDEEKRQTKRASARFYRSG